MIEIVSLSAEQTLPLLHVKWSTASKKWDSHQQALVRGRSLLATTWQSGDPGGIMGHQQQAYTGTKTFSLSWFYDFTVLRSYIQFWTGLYESPKASGWMIGFKFTTALLTT